LRGTLVVGGAMGVTQPVDSSILHEIVRIVEARSKVPDKVAVKGREYQITYLEDHQRRLEEALMRFDRDRLNMLYGQLASKVKYQLLRRLPARPASKAEPKKAAPAARPASRRPVAKPARPTKGKVTSKPRPAVKAKAAKRKPTKPAKPAKSTKVPKTSRPAKVQKPAARRARAARKKAGKKK
jgi:hypothetical protein